MRSFSRIAGYSLLRASRGRIASHVNLARMCPSQLTCTTKLAASLSTASNSTETGKFLTSQVTESGVAMVTLDAQGEKMNTLSTRAMSEFEAILDKIEKDSSIRSVVLLSGKPDNWVAGADIKMLDSAKTAEELAKLSEDGQKIMNRIEKIWKEHKKPVVAAINGACLGGGLELALACQYRIATSGPATKLGLPEVMLGLLPGAGGTQRLPKTVGIQQSLTVMTTGQNIKPAKAKKMGLVHAVVDPSALKPAAEKAASDIASGTLKVPSRKIGTMEKLLEGNPIGRSVLFKKAGEMIQKKAGSNYPAPHAILECVKAGVENGLDKGLEKERKEFGQLGMTEASAALRGIFFSQTSTKKNPFGKPKHGTKNVAVLGAGLMGAGIAQVSAANAGCHVLLKDKFEKGLERGEKQIRSNLDQKVKRRRMTAFEKEAIMSRVVGVSDDQVSWGGFGATPQPGSNDANQALQRHLSNTDLVIEAIFEDLKIKQDVIQELEPMLPEHAVFATNTSAIPIEEIAKAAKRPERVLGMHYFSPVDKMPLLEIIPHKGTSDDAAAQAVAHGYKQGKTVIVVKDVPGFYVNRCLGPFMTEAVALLQAGVDAQKMDRKMKNFGFPVGPITLTDEVGIDVAMHVQKFLSDKLDVRMQGADSGLLEEFVNKGFLGRKSGKGFFTYGDGKSKGKKEVNQEAVELLKRFINAPSKPVTEDEAQERMTSRFLNEAIYCLQDGIIRNAADGDVGAVFGIGFPPFRGGPFRYIDNAGPQKILDTMQKYADTVGPQFQPAPLLQEMASKNKKFHEMFGASQE